MHELTESIIQIVCLLITAGGTYLLALLRKKTALLEQEIDNKTAMKYIDMAYSAVEQSVTYVAQTYVDALKKEDRFTKVRQVEAFNMAKTQVLNILGETAVKCLNEIYGDFELWMDTEIEKVCREIKQPVTAAALPAADADEKQDEELHPDVLRAMNDDTPPTSTPDEWPAPLPAEPEEAKNDDTEAPQAVIE